MYDIALKSDYEFNNRCMICVEGDGLRVLITGVRHCVEDDRRVLIIYVRHCVEDGRRVLITGV